MVYDFGYQNRQILLNEASHMLQILNFVFKNRRT